MTTNDDTTPGFTVEELEQQQRQRAPEEDEGVTYDDELDQKRIIDDALSDESNVLPSERREEDTPDERGSTRVDDEVRGQKRKEQYEGGADLVSELD
jgi:hypothetical protein